MRGRGQGYPYFLNAILSAEACFSNIRGLFSYSMFSYSMLWVYKIGKLQECRTTIVVGDCWLVAGGAVLEACGVTLGVLWRVFGWISGTIVFILGAGYFRGLRGNFWCGLHFARSLKLLGFI